MKIKIAVLQSAVVMGTLFGSLFGTFNAFAADVVYVHQNRGGGGTLDWEDDQWRALIEGAGHTILAHEPFDDLDAAPEDLDILNSADVVIFSRDSNSGDYNEPDEQEAWAEGVTVPMMIMTPFTVRNNRWDMVDSASILDTDKDTGIDPLEAYVPDHPVFAGALNENGEADIWDEDLLGPNDSIDFLNVLDEDGMVGNGEVLGIEPSNGVPWLIYWEQGVDYYDGSLWVAGGDRLYYTVGSDDDPETWGEKNTTEAGDRIFLNAISWLAGEDMGGVAGDFNDNGMRDIADLDLLTAGVAAGDAAFDLDGDGDADADDRVYWVETLSNTFLGDSNFDGEFSSADFVTVFVPAKYETNEPATWAEGDWNGDGVFGSADFVAAFVGAGYENGPRDGGLMVVPEPSTSLLVLVGLAGLLVRRRSGN